MTDDDLLKKAAEAVARAQDLSEKAKAAETTDVPPEPPKSLQPPEFLEPVEPPESFEPVEPPESFEPVEPPESFEPPYPGPADYEAADQAPFEGAAPAPFIRRRISPRSPRQAIEPEAAPPPPPRSRHARHPLVVVMNFFMMACVLGVLALGAGLYFGAKRFNAEGPLTESKNVLISRGADLASIAGLLERQNVIDSSFIFSAGVRLSNAADKLKAGEYLFEARASMREVMDALVSGKAILQSFSVPEGLTSHEIVAKLLEDSNLTGEVAAVPQEGALLPDTYKFARGTTRQQVIDQMRRARERMVEEIWARRSDDLPIATKDEFVTLASIVEKETGKADERPLVASVFINRLRRNMRLQSDPTIIYGLFGGPGKPPDRPIFRSDIDKHTPYNTYQIDGLPPGPIANPGRAALEAVANPSRTDHLYFVADGSGGHTFAATLDEHNRNVERWRRIEEERRKAEAAAQKAQEEAAGAAQAGDGGNDGDAAANGPASEATGGNGNGAKPKAKPQ